MRPSALPAAGPVPMIKVWAKTEAGAALRHPSNGRAPRDWPNGLSVPDDAFTARRLVDGDWTATAPVGTDPAAATPAAAPPSRPARKPADPAA